MKRVEAKGTIFKHLILLDRRFENRNPLHLELPHIFDRTLVTDDAQRSALQTAVGKFSSEKKDAFAALHNFNGKLFFLNGFAGSGKAHWAMHLAAMAQMQTADHANHKAMYLLETKKAVDNASVKLKKIFEKLRVDKKIIRIASLPARVRMADKDDRRPTDSEPCSGEVLAKLDFSVGFLRQTLRPVGDIVGTNASHGDVQSLDEAAFQWFNEHRGSFPEVAKLVEEINEEFMDQPQDAQNLLPELSIHLEPLYQAAISSADTIIATASAVAHPLMSESFNPYLIIFDQAAMARELSTLVPFGFYNPAAVVLVGDIHQLLPASRALTMSEPERLDPLRISMLSRALVQDSVHVHFRVNHRAYGRLHELPSKIFYNNALESSIPLEKTFPPPVQAVRRYMDATRGKKSVIPRLLVDLFHSRWTGKDGGGFWNPVHHAWVMPQIVKLLCAPWFRSVDGKRKGSILVISSHKGSSAEYDTAMEDWPSHMRGRVTLRTVNTAQGSQGDIVIVDLVKPSDYTDDPNRLAVALSKSIQGEIILMNHYMSLHRLVPGQKVPSEVMCKIWDECRINSQILNDRKYGEAILHKVRRIQSLDRYARSSVNDINDEIREMANAGSAFPH